ncbi:DUF397 domain-containing protein [Kitasatospora sp. NPDC056076]|uniref:DUF397 domain-containing protein n=1 Tax=Kitasatospora sp. NPDC056076 TaxID=3345703 RepID=UPI0035DC2F4A
MIANGVRADTIADARWIKAAASNGVGQCVEVATLPGGDIAMRNSRHKDGPALVFTPDEVRTFIIGAKAGEFDHMYIR